MLNKNIKVESRIKRSTIDTATGTISGVHLIGLQSVNIVNPDKGPYTYSETALKNAVDKYKDVPINLNHSYTDTVERKIGVVLSATHEDGKGVVGDIQLNVKHPMYEAVMWWVENHPTHIGMSHVASSEYDEDLNSVVKINEVLSVDLVYEGATTPNGMFAESNDPMSVVLKAAVDLDRWLHENFIHPINKNVIDSKESALQYAAVLRTALQTINAKPKDPGMEYPDITLEALTKNRSDLVKTIADQAIKAEQDLSKRVAEAIATVPADKRSDVFIEQVRNALADNKTDYAKALVEDRTKILTVELPESTTSKPRATKPAVVVTDAEISATLK